MAPRGAIEVEVSPPWPFRLPWSARDGTMRVRDGVVQRLLHVDGEAVLVRVWEQGRSVRFRAESGAKRALMSLAIERMRFALGVDEDYADFYALVRGDRLLGPIVRRRPWLRPRRRPWPWEALAWAVTEQLIEAERASAIQRRIVHRWGPSLRLSEGCLRDVPQASVIAALAPAELASVDLAPKRAIALRRVAREVASGRADLDRHEPAWRRLLAIPEIGPWTVETLALKGQGRNDQLPAGDLAYVKLVGAMAGLGRRASVEEVHEFFAPYAPYKGLAGTFLLAGRAVARRAAAA